MSFAKELNTVANNVMVQKQEEIVRRAQAIYDNFKPTLKHYASRGNYQTDYIMPLSESCKKDRLDVLLALRKIFIDEGFKVRFDAKNNGMVVSWENVNE
jgi:hypothetical protein